MAASYNANKIIFKNLTFEIMDVKKCPVRNVSDGTQILFWHKKLNNSETSLFMNKIFIIFLLSTWLLHIMQIK